MRHDLREAADPSLLTSPCLSDHLSGIEGEEDDAFAVAEFTNQERRHASEYSPDETTLFSSWNEEVQQSYENDNNEMETNARMSRREWWELEQSTVHEKEEEWLSLRSQPILVPQSLLRTDSDPNYSQDASQDKPEQNFNLPLEDAEKMDFETTLQHNLRGCGPRFDFFLEGCLWRVEDMLTEANDTLRARPAARDVDACVGAPAFPKIDRLVFESNNSNIEAQAALVEDIDRLLTPLKKRSQALIGAKAEEMRKETGRGSRLPKLISRAIEIVQEAKVATKNRISVGVWGGGSRLRLKRI